MPTTFVRLIPCTLLCGVVWLATRSGQAQVPVAPGVLQVGTIAHFAISEASGLAASRRHPGVIWTHNDGGYQFLFALTQAGEGLGAFQVVGANLIDWEAIAPDDDGNLYLADIGADGMARSHVAVHRVREPHPAQSYGNAEVSRSWYLRFPNLREDCEAFFVLDGFGYLLTKPRLEGSITMYRYPLSSRANSILLEEVTKIPVAGSVTDAALSPDHQRLGLVSGAGAHLFYINGRPETAGSTRREFTPFVNDFVEGGAFVDAGFLVSAETRQLYLFTNGGFRSLVRARPDLRITEVMPSPALDSTGPTADWWELTSFETQPIDLSGWRFNDSVGLLGDPFVFGSGPILAPGESIVFVETLTPQEFVTWWGATNLPPGLQIVSYSGSGLSFRITGDTLHLWDASSTDAADAVARVDFGPATFGVTFIYDPGTQQFGMVSQLGSNGVIRAANGFDIGSPGRIVAPNTGSARPARLQIVGGAGQNQIRIEFEATAGSSYWLDAAETLDAGAWTPTGDFFRATTNGMMGFERERNVPMQFYRLRILAE